MMDGYINETNKTIPSYLKVRKETVRQKLTQLEGVSKLDFAAAVAKSGNIREVLIHLDFRYNSYNKETVSNRIVSEQVDTSHFRRYHPTKKGNVLDRLEKKIDRLLEIIDK
jgi:hypothetical protein